MLTPLALVAVAQQNPDPYYQAPKSNKSYAPPSKQSSSTRSNASTKYKGKEIAKPITPPSESASEEDSDPKQAQRDKEMQKITLIQRITISPGSFLESEDKTIAGDRMTNAPGIVQQNRDELVLSIAKNLVPFANELPETQKRAKDYKYHKEKMLLCKQDEEGVPLQAEQDDWLEDTDEEVDEQELEAHYSFMAKIQEVLTADSGSDAEPLEKVDRNVIPLHRDSGDTDDQECKRHHLVLKKLKECKSTLEKTTRALRESNSTRDSCLIAFQNQKIELEKHKTYLNRLENDKLELEYLEYIKSLEKEIEELESDKANFSNTYDLLLQECVSKDVMCSYLHSLPDLIAQAELQCLYVHKVKTVLYGGGSIPFQLKSDSLPHAHAQTTKTYYKRQDSRIKKAQVLKTKTSANSDIKDNSSETKLRGRLLESFQEDAKYEHVGHDTRSQGGKDDLERKDEVERQCQRLKIKDHTT
ncbi:hypothetical protein Tco_0281707 [Tanacetum coccineum]